MAYTKLALALTLTAAAPAMAYVQAPQGSETTRYCMRITLTGNVIEPVRCWTRDQWADQGVDVDKEWAKEGVAIIQ